MAKVTIYGKPGCHLCDEARAVVHSVAEPRGVPVEEVDVSVDPGLHNRYGERIPVIAIDGEELFEYFVDPGVLRERLDRVGA
jgi:glutaredoxin